MKYGCVVSGDEPDDGVVDVRVLLSKLVPEIYDAPGVGDSREELRRQPRKGGHRFADDDELTLNRRAHQPVGGIGGKTRACQGLFDGFTGFDDVAQVRACVTLHREAASLDRWHGLCSGSSRLRP